MGQERKRWFTGLQKVVRHGATPPPPLKKRGRGEEKGRVGKINMNKRLKSFHRGNHSDYEKFEEPPPSFQARTYIHTHTLSFLFPSIFFPVSVHVEVSSRTEEMIDFGGCSVPGMKVST